MMTLDGFHDLMSDEDTPIELDITETGDLSIVAPDEIVENSEFVESLVENAEKVLYLATKMGMLFPDKFAKLLEEAIINNEESAKNEQ